jgi:hypothetical protein
MEKRAGSRRTEDGRAAISARLQIRRSELEQLARDRAYSISDPPEADPSYSEGLRGAISSAIDYGLNVVERGEGSASPPRELLLQARLAARRRISLDVVLRRYTAGHSLLNDFVLQEARNGRLSSISIQCVMRDLAAAFDRLLATISAEHIEESRTISSTDRRADRIRRLLAGELLDTSDFSYNFAGWHVGALIGGSRPVEAVRELEKARPGAVLWVRSSDDLVWSWVGGQHSFASADLDLVQSVLGAKNSLALGQPGHGMGGWRLTHKQARAALPVALRKSQRVARYADVALTASMLQDDVLVMSLWESYLAPLSSERDGGKALRETMRAYLSAERNLSSAAALLGVSRRTVANRLRAVEAIIDRPLSTVLASIDVALHFEELGLYSSLSSPPDAR